MVAAQMTLEGWQPILAGDARDAALGVVADVVATLDRLPDEDPSLLGLAGQAVLLAYVEHADVGIPTTRRATELLERALEHSQRYGTVGLWGGLADLGFVLAHFVDDHFPRGPLDTVEQAILAALQEPAIPFGIDLIDGLSGLGVLALEHLERDPIAKAAQEISRRVLDGLQALAVTGETGLVWIGKSYLHEPASIAEGFFNLGLAHGTPGVVALLARYLAAGIEPERTAAMLEGAMSGLLAAAPQMPNGRYPAKVRPTGREPPARQAWCYGDPGVATAIIAAAHVAGREEWRLEGAELIATMLERPFESSGVVDFGLCHGSAGLAHICNRLFQATGDETLAVGARSWIMRALAMRRPGEGIAGFLAYTPHLRERWSPDASLLTGAVGLALALLAAATDIEPAWDRVLLLDVPKPAPTRVRSA